MDSPTYPNIEGHLTPNTPLTHTSFTYQKLNMDEICGLKFLFITSLFKPLNSRTRDVCSPKPFFRTDRQKQTDRQTDRQTDGNTDGASQIVV